VYDYRWAKLYRILEALTRTSHQETKVRFPNELDQSRVFDIYSALLPHNRSLDNESHTEKSVHS